MSARIRLLAGGGSIAVAALACNNLVGWQSNYVEAIDASTEASVGQDAAPAEGGPSLDGGSDSPVGTDDGSAGDGSTSDGSTCTNACASGATECASAWAIETCGTSSACTAWSAPTTCATDAGISPYVCERFGDASCGDPNWAEWPVPNASVDSPPAPNLESYTNNGDGTITDNVTKLMWQQYQSTQTATYENASLACQALLAGGHQDWRLPTVMELVSIVDFTLGPPTVPIDSAYFLNTTADYFWTSTPQAGPPPTQVWTVSFYDGSTYPNAPSTTNQYRCVR